jgi:hypothetical protein
VDDKAQVNELSTKDLRNLFKLRADTPSDTHDKLRCERCETIVDNADQDAKRVLPKQLSACKDLMEVMAAHEDASLFLTPVKPEDHDVSSVDYDKVVKQPIDIGTIKAKLNAESTQSNAYKSPSAFSKDVNRIFTNVMKVFAPGQEIADAGRRLQSWWMEQWASLVPRLMNMKPDDDIVDSASNKVSGDDDGLKCAFVNNERGDNFQEQIGMPDEENMRHWSHHHSSDTVDDPVFRAAMRGFDSVSFVFGLEVTWSLIQQRQQEEEEKQAMLELECIQELDEDEIEKTTDVSKEITKEECNQGVVEVVEGEVLDISSVEGEEADSAETTEEVAEDNEMEDTKEPSENSSSQETKETEAEPVEICEEKKDDDHDMNDEISVSVKKELSRGEAPQAPLSTPDKKRSPASKGWVCVSCTFENTASKKKCAMCGYKNKSPKKRRR